MSAHGIAGPGAAPERPGQKEGRPEVAPSRPDLRVVESPAATHRRHRVRFTMLAAGAFVALVVFGLVGLHVMLAQNQFRLDRLNARNTVEEARYQRLRLEVAQLEAPQRIVATAQGRLGMVAPPGVTYLTPSSPPPATSPRAATAPAVVSPSTPAAGEGPKDWAAVKPQLVARQ